MTSSAPTTPSDPDRDCPRCPRLVEYRAALRAEHPDWWNAPVASFGARDARLLIVGLAPGARGANRTARPFTGDWAGDLLYATLIGHGFARGTYDARADDGLELVDCRITNAVRCVPPQNKPVGAEVNTCRDYLAATIAEMGRLTHLVTLGKIAHDSLIRALGERVAAHPFGHGATYRIGGRTVVASYHCSRYNTNTGRLTPEMFDTIFASVRAAM